MRFLISFLILAMAFTVAHAKKNPADESLKEYFESATKKSEARSALRDMKRVDIARGLSDYIKNEETREDALDLAIELKVPYLYPHLDDVLEDELLRGKAISLLMETQEEDAIEDFYKSYKKTDDKMERMAIYDAFMLHGIHPKLLKKIKTDVFREKKDLQFKAEMLEVLRFQMNLTEEATAAVIKKNWKELWRVYEMSSKPVETDGWNVLRYDDITETKTRPSGFNTRIEEGGTIRFNMRAEKWQKKSLTIKAWLYLPKDSNAGVTVRSGSGAWTAVSNEKEWFIQSRDKNKIKRYNEWQELVITVVDQSTKDGTPKQMLSFTIGGNEFFPSKGYINGGLLDIEFNCTAGEFIIGSLYQE